MKLYQNEWCHNCAQVVRFEFEDVTGNQVIFCPVCQHQHFRAIDQGNLTNIRMDSRASRGGQVVIVRAPFHAMAFDGSDTLDKPMEVETVEVLGTRDGCAIVAKPVPGSTPTKAVTGRRWGVDPSQRT